MVVVVVRSVVVTLSVAVEVLIVVVVVVVLYLMLAVVCHLWRYLYQRQCPLLSFVLTLSHVDGY